MGLSTRTESSKRLTPKLSVPAETTAALLTQLKAPLEIRTLKIPELKRGQALVRIAYSGICHSQLNEILGKKGQDKFLPHCLGHEGSGVVLKTSADVTKVKAGDRVVLTWIKGSGANAPSAQYESSKGLVNSGAISTFMNCAVVSENRLVPIPENMPLLQAALLGCAIPTGVGIVLNTAKVREGSSVAIFGLGGIGLSALLGTKLIPNVKVFAVDISKDKLDRIAVQFGVGHKINALKENPVALIRELTQGEGVDYAIEAAGKKKSMEAAFQSVKPGGLCVIAGNLAQGEKISMDPFDLILGKRIMGTWGGETNPDRDIPRYAQDYLAGRLPLDPLITHQYTLTQINKALQDFIEGKVGRAIINFEANSS